MTEYAAAVQRQIAALRDCLDQPTPRRPLTPDQVDAETAADARAEAGEWDRECQADDARADDHAEDLATRASERMSEGTE